MSKQSSAAKVIKFGAARGYTPEQIATLLNELNLLASDLPEPNDLDISAPDEKLWLPCGPTGPSIWARPCGRVRVRRIEPGDLTPDEARGVAYALLAAADYAEEA